jgi:hypothetical protein
MKSKSPDYLNVSGKTYSLFANSDSTSEYFMGISALANEILENYADISKVINDLSQFSSKKRALKKVLGNLKSSDNMSTILRTIDPHLRKYTESTEEHLRTIKFSGLLDRRLATSREQYHLYMLEIELTNRLFENEFKKADKKIALLPYCLRDLSVKCRSEKKGFDFQCKQCSAKCFQNHASDILKKHHIEPFIWMEGDMKQLAKYTLKQRKSLGVLGIACIPELTWGMRDCRKNNIPVVGIPLNANRCIRWFGEFLPNSVDLTELEKLVDPLIFKQTHI